MTLFWIYFHLLYTTLLFFSILYRNVWNIHTNCFCIWAFACSFFLLFFVIKNPSSGIWSCHFSIIASKTFPNGSDVIWSIGQWRHGTSIWESEKRPYIWELDVDLSLTYIMVSVCCFVNKLNLNLRFTGNI